MSPPDSSKRRARVHRAREMCSTLALVAILRILTTEVGASEQVFVLGDAAVRLGRADDNDVVLLEQLASRHHARVEPTDDGYAVVDLDSSGGITVNGNPSTRHPLRDGDEVRIGGTVIRYVEHPGSEATILPSVDTPPSSLPTEVGEVEREAPGVETSPAPLGDADTLLPGDAPSSTPTALPDHESDDIGSTVHAPHAPAPPPGPPRETIAAPHQPAPPPAVPLDVHPVEPPKEHAKSNPSFVLGDGQSSPSQYTLDAPGPGAPGASGGYSLDGDRRGGLSMDTVPPTALRRGPGAGLFVVMGLLGAAISFGVLVAVQGVPW